MSETSWKRTIGHELVQLAEVFLIVVLFSLMLATYRMMLLDAFDSKYFLCGAAIVNAAVISKVIAIGERARVGKRMEDKPLIVSVLYKSFAFSVLVTSFELLEEAAKGLMRGHVVFNELGGVHKEEFIARIVVLFLAFVPFFAFREMTRVVGKRRTFDLFFRRRPASGFINLPVQP